MGKKNAHEEWLKNLPPGKSGDKTKAALAWMAEQRQIYESRDTRRYWAILIIGILTIAGAVAGVAATKGWL